MSPASRAPRYLPSALLRPKDISAACHDVAHAPRAVAVEVTPSRISLVARSKTLPVSHPLAASPPTLAQLQDAVQLQLSERDSIFATHYVPPDSSITSPAIAATEEGETAEGERKGSGEANMAVSPTRSLTEPSSIFHSDVPASAIPISHHIMFNESPSHSRPGRSGGLPPSRQRRSLYGPEDLHTLHMTTAESQRPNGSDSSNTTLASHDAQPQTPATPSTPSSVRRTEDYAREWETSAERQRYRSWRQGKAKLNGMSIAQSQRTKTQAELAAMEKKIDAQLPMAEPAANPRSRKASHYLGLFKGNDEEQRQRDESTRSKLSKELRDDLIAEQQTVLPRDDSKQVGCTGERDTLPAAIKAVEDGNGVTAPKIRVAQNLPLSLLEEIRNHYRLAPTAKSASKPAYRKHRNAHLGEEQPDEITSRRNSVVQQDDEDSDKEHISSALYYPHTGPAFGEALIDNITTTPAAMASMKQGAAAEEVSIPKPDDETSAASGHVDIALHSGLDLDYLHGDIPPPPPPKEKTPHETVAVPSGVSQLSDSDYESDFSRGYESSVSEDEEDTTPTATPTEKTAAPGSVSHSPRTRHHRTPPAPIGAVELMPYDHQVGGHSTVYQFSRRAVCKQLNSRENVFYETVERKHRELLGFMPRYIGVLNVTYRKAKKRSKQASDENANQKGPDDGSKSHVDTPGRDDSPEQQRNDAMNSSHARIVSHSQLKTTSIPQVIFENNRHIIPQHLFGYISPRPSTSSSEANEVSRRSPDGHSFARSDQTSNISDRPPTRQTASWGYTTVNTKLQAQVLREVFSPPVIYRHDRRDRSHHSRSVRNNSQAQDRPPRKTLLERRSSADVSALSAEHSDTNSTRKQVLRNQHERRVLEEDDDALTDVGELLREGREGTSNLSRSAERSKDEEGAAAAGSKHRRRHSGSGLLTKPRDIEGSRGDLEYHDGDGYGADGGDVFAMDDLKKDVSAATYPKPSTSQVNAGTESMEESGATVNKIPFLAPPIDMEPRNPEQSLVQQDERVEHFILLEDLTAGMAKPCVLDLKMGTRQYGIEANKKKQESQRQKCKTTTSRELGVRVCGMQVFDVRKQSYIFEDKYFGRDIKAGKDFRDALTRYFFDGIGHAQALKHIPLVLEKIASLEQIIQQLPGYRLYASSLLMIYDRGDADENGKLRPSTYDQADSQASGKDPRPSPPGEIKLKIVDFANCVTQEALHTVVTKPCPPHRPHDVDRGYLRGLRTLRIYFQRIWEELANQRHVERGEGEAMAVEERSVSVGTARSAWADSAVQDPGEVSV